MSLASDIDQLALLSKTVSDYREELLQLNVDMQKLQRDLAETKKRREAVQRYLSEAEAKLKKSIKTLGEKVDDPGR